MRNTYFLLYSVDEETKIQCGNNIKLGVTEIGQVGVDSSQLFEDSALADFTNSVMKHQEPQAVSSYLIIWPHEGPDTKKHFVSVKEYLGQLLYNKTNQMYQSHKFILARNSTCFGQFLCPSSGLYSLYTQQWYMS